MRIITYILVFIVCLLIQSSLVDLISIKNIKPDLLLIFLVYIAKNEGELAGTLAGFFIGLFQDMFETQFLGLSSLCKSVAGFVTGRLKTRERKSELVTLGTFLLIVGLLHNLIFYSIRLAGSGYGFIRPIFRFILPETLYTLVFGLIIFSLLPQKWLRSERNNE